MNFPAWMRETRRQRQLTVIECAKLAGVSQPAWTEWENKDSNHQFRRETVLKIADALGVSRADALLASGRSAYDPDVELGRKLWPILMQAPEHKRRQIECALEHLARTLVETAA